MRLVRSWKHPCKGVYNGLPNLRTGITAWQLRVSLCRFRGPYNRGIIAPRTRNSDIALTNRLAGGLFMSGHKTVHVCAYTRVRKGRLEYVITHWRSPPG